jgi:23S rRNA pseudouridine2605 synthase
MLNKPRGSITTTSDEKGRATVYQFLSHSQLPWVAPVGRLDKASEGLLLFTNDSEWAAKVLAPETNLEKKYHVRVDAAADDMLIQKLSRGVETEAGWLRVGSARVIRGGTRRSWLEIVLDEGKNRHIRRIFEHLGIEVLRLVRIAIGPLALGDLPKGAVRALTASEKKALDNAMHAQRVRG